MTLKVPGLPNGFRTFARERISHWSIPLHSLHAGLWAWNFRPDPGNILEYAMQSLLRTSIFWRGPFSVPEILRWMRFTLVLREFPSDAHVFHCADSIKGSDDDDVDEYPVDYLNSIESCSLPSAHLEVKPVILGGISSLYPTYSMTSTGISISRKDLQYDGAFENWHAQASDEAEHYLITR
jgi:hypothetical protein